MNYSIRWTWVWFCLVVALFILNPATSLSIDSSTQMMQRIERILANRGLGSRSECLALIKSGKVKTAEGQPIKSSSLKLPINTKLLVNGEVSEQAPLLLCYYKPFGVLTSVGDSWGRRNLEEVISRHLVLKQMHPVGRLDADTTGLLLFSREGSLTQTLLNPSNKIQRSYEVLVEGKVNFEELRTRLAQGVKTSDGVFPAELQHAVAFHEEQDRSYLQGLVTNLFTSKSSTAVKAQDEELEDGDNQFDLLSRSKLVREFSYVKLTVTEGKYRMVRRILHNAGHSVLLLHRSHYGMVHLNTGTPPAAARLQDIWPPASNLKEGDIRYCNDEELAWAQRLLKS